MKFMLSAAAAVSALAMAPAAHAAVSVIPGQTTVEARTNSDNTSISFDDASIALGSFTETLRFSNSEATNLIFTLGTSFAGINFTNVFLTQGNSNTPIFSLTGNRGANVNPEQLSGTFLAGAGNFTLNITGNNTGPGPGTLAGTVSMSAVPEPTTWAMMLVGFGAVGYSMRKRPSRRLQMA